MHRPYRLLSFAYRLQARAIRNAPLGEGAGGESGGSPAMRSFLIVIALLAAAALVAACGGGGGGSGDAGPQTPPPPPPVVTPGCVQTVLGCLTQARYEVERERIEDEHNGEDDFKNQWGLETIRADRAYAQLELELGIDTAPGSGQTVGLIDSGIDQDHPVFAGKTITEVLVGSTVDEDGSRFSHGTAVASVIAARRDAMFNYAASPAHGVAWGADIAMFALPAGSGGGNYVPISLADLAASDDAWASLIDYVVGWSSAALDFVNVSVGFPGIIEQYTTQQLRDNYGDAIAAYAQSSGSEKTVFVIAAGNAHGDPCVPADFVGNADLCESYLDSNNETKYRVNAKSVDIDAGLPAHIAELRGHMIAVVAVAPDTDDDGDYEIASFSNRCGIAARWCIAAPGVNIRLVYFGPHNGVNGQRRNGTSSGTSYSAPMVVGALVVMKHHFRDEIANTGLVSRLLATAYDEGIYADSAIYGHGLLDLAAAISPQGVPRVTLGGRVDGPGVALVRSRLTLGNALGDGLTRALAGQEIAAFDSLGAPFWYALGAFARSADGPSPMARLKGFMARPQAGGGSVFRRPVLGMIARDEAGAGPGGLRLGLPDAPAPDAGGGHLSLAGRALSLSAAGQGGLGAAAFTSEGLDGEPPASGAVLSWRPAGAPLGLRGGFVGEREAVLGSRGAGAFGRMSAGSAFAGVEGSAYVGAWRLGAGAEVGTVNASAQGGLIADLSPLTTSAFSLHAERPLGEDGAFTLSLSQPLRVEAGRARLSVPVGRTKDGRVRRRSLTADLAPTGRQIEVAAQWRRPLAEDSELRLGATWTRHPGHAAAADPDLTLLAGWRHAF